MNDPEGYSRIDKDSLIQYVEQLEVDLDDQEAELLACQQELTDAYLHIDELQIQVEETQAKLWDVPA